MGESNRFINTIHKYNTRYLSNKYLGISNEKFNKLSITNFKDDDLRNYPYYQGFVYSEQ